MKHIEPPVCNTASGKAALLHLLASDFFLHSGFNQMSTKPSHTSVFIPLGPWPLERKSEARWMNCVARRWDSTVKLDGVKLDGESRRWSDEIRRWRRWIWRWSSIEFGGEERIHDGGLNQNFGWRIREQWIREPEYDYVSAIIEGSSC